MESGSKKMTQYIYECECSNREHSVSAIRHIYIQRGKVYRCWHCMKAIKFTGKVT